MNRSAYLTTGLAIKTIEYFSNADIGVHGRGNIPTSPTIFVINHFTRFETFVLPYYIHNLTSVPVWSLGSSQLFQGVFGTFFDLVGVVSTKDPKRDTRIIKGLLTGDAHWVIFPEGSMIKTKKIVSDGDYMVTTHQGMRKPHTGAATLALKSELIRRRLLEEKDPVKALQLRQSVGLEDGEALATEATVIVPVNLTYYPIRAVENFMVKAAQRLVKDIPERVVEELMLEGSMLINGVDLDIRFGKPIKLEEYLSDVGCCDGIMDYHETGQEPSSEVRDKVYQSSMGLMQRYMKDIYRLTTVNHEHLFASFLRLYPHKHIHRKDLCRRVYMATLKLLNRSEEDFYLHKSFNASQLHLVGDDRYGKFQNFIDLAVEKEVFKDRGQRVEINRKKLSSIISVHRGRIENPIEVMANEVEPLEKLYGVIKSWAWQPDILVRYLFIKHLLQQSKQRYKLAVERFVGDQFHGKKRASRMFPSYRLKTGVLLIHSYLSTPKEMEELARYLQKRGYWVYCVRLAGHGTAELDLAHQKLDDWRESVDVGYCLLSAICENVVVGGLSSGGLFALDAAARIADIKGVFTISVPSESKSFHAPFIPPQDVWNSLLAKIGRRERREQFFPFSPPSSAIYYKKNPISAAEELSRLFTSLTERVEGLKQPLLMIEADDDQLMEKQCGLQINEQVQSEKKEYSLLHSSHHYLLDSPEKKVVMRKIASFVKDLS